MKKIRVSPISFLFIVIVGCLFLNQSLKAQDVSKSSAVLPDNINKIVSVSCMPCHSSTGGLMPKSKLNFSEWDQYSPEKQKKKAEKMYEELNKGAMPPKSARENNPSIIPTKEQIEIIKKWSETIPEPEK
jgi:hypothetical protein